MRRRSPRVSSSKSFGICSRKMGWKGCSASDLPGTRAIHGATARLVRGARAPQSTLATELHALSGVGVGGDATADAGRHGDPVLRAFHGAISRCGVGGGGAAGRGAAFVDGLGVLRSGA